MSRRTRAVAVAVNACRLACGNSVAELAEPAVLGPEVVAPLADAVRFVHGDEAHADLSEPAHEAIAAIADQPFGRHVQQSRLAFAHALHHGALLLLVERAVVAGRRHAVADEARPPGPSSAR